MYIFPEHLGTVRFPPLSGVILYHFGIASKHCSTVRTHCDRGISVPPLIMITRHAHHRGPGRRLAQQSMVAQRYVPRRISRPSCSALSTYTNTINYTYSRGAKAPLFTGEGPPGPVTSIRLSKRKRPWCTETNAPGKGSERGLGTGCMYYLCRSRGSYSGFAEK